MTQARTLVVLFGIQLALLASHATRPAVAADFDGDGIADLAIGVRKENVGAIVDAGAFHVLFGSLTGLTDMDNQFWIQDDLVATDGAETEDYFGHSLAAGDFNGDGAIDLAVGVPDEDIGNAVDGGAVHLMYSIHGQGPATPGNVLLHQGSPGIDGAVETNDHFGFAICTGDFNGDGYADLAVGVPTETIGIYVAAGAVNVLFGGPGGLGAAGNRLLYEGHGLSGIPENFVRLGSVLASGDFDGDGYSDLAISIDSQNVDGAMDAGEVRIIYGSAQGLVDSTEQSLAQGADGGLLGTPEDYDHLGSSLTSGDFNGDGRDDLAIGVPREDNGHLQNTGLVHIVFGSPDGLILPAYWAYYDPAGGTDEHTKYGWALTAEDFNGDGYEELAISMPSDAAGNTDNAGTVDILYGSSTGPRRRPEFDDLWHQDRDGVFGTAEDGDEFGFALAAGDFDHDGFADLAVGVVSETIDAAYLTGAVNVLYGSADGIAAAGNQLWYQDSPGVHGTPEPEDQFGYALAAIPRSAVVFRDGFESGETSRWSQTVP